MALLRIASVLAAVAAIAQAQEALIPEEPASEPPVRITFTPPDIDGRIVLGIFDDTGTLVRTLHPHPDGNDLKVDTNGYIAEWDGRDESGDRCNGGRYSASGYIVGDAVEIEGEAYHFNDWLAQDGVPVTGVEILPTSRKFLLSLAVAGDEVPRIVEIDESGELTWKMALTSSEGNGLVPNPPDLPVKPLFETPGADSTWWVIFEDGSQRVVSQVSSTGEALREFREPNGEPQPVAIEASLDNNDAILVREESDGGVVCIRLLRKGQSKEDEGKIISDWDVVFERSLGPCSNFGLKDGRLVASSSDAPRNSMEVTLVENALEPGTRTLQVTAKSSGAGSALFSPEGLELLPISTGGNWNRFAIAPEAGKGEWTIYQGNGIGVEEFSVKNLSEIAAYDAGSFLLAPARE